LLVVIASIALLLGGYFCAKGFQSVSLEEHPRSGPDLTAFDYEEQTAGKISMEVSHGQFGSLGRGYPWELDQLR
jgi:hypothetical protein